MTADDCYMKVIESVIAKLKEKNTHPSINPETIENLRNV